MRGTVPSRLLLLGATAVLLTSLAAGARMGATFEPTRYSVVEAARGTWLLTGVALGSIAVATVAVLRGGRWWAGLLYALAPALAGVVAWLSPGDLLIGFVLLPTAIVTYLIGLALLVSSTSARHAERIHG